MSHPKSQIILDTASLRPNRLCDFCKEPLNVYKVASFVTYKTLCAHAADSLEEALCGMWKASDEATTKRKDLIVELRKAAE